MTVLKLKVFGPLTTTLLLNEKPLTQLHRNHKELMAPLRLLMHHMVLLAEIRQTMKVKQGLDAKAEDKVDGLDQGNKPVVNGIY